MRLSSGVQKACRPLVACLFLFCCLALQVNAKETAPELSASETIDRVKATALAETRAWRILLHFPDGASESVIDDPTFFLSPDGKYSPQTELEVTLNAMLAPIGPQEDDHALCRYPARTTWLKRQLAIDDSNLPRPVCSNLQKYLDTTNAQSASLLFPAAYMNSPASMFGHTYLRINGDYRSFMLGYAINYAARTDETNGFEYAWKGIFGMYKGYFSILPHYAKVREYNGMEHRDIWEYSLNLTPDEVRDMVLHIWELEEHYTDYYFFDENCSYNLLFLLEAARPSLQLTSNRPLWVAPLNTVIQIKEAGLVSDTRYWPSQSGRISLLAEGLSADDVDLATRLARDQKDIAYDPASELPERDARILDLAAELLQHEFDKQRISREKYRDRLLKILTKRSKLPSIQIPAVETPIEPALGHASSRISLGVGLNRGKFFTEIGFRPTYHALEDPSPGYTEGAQIQFMNLRVRWYPSIDEIRWYPNLHGVKLQRLDLVDIVSLAPYERIFQRVSWRVTGGFTNILNRRDSDKLVWQLVSGGGLTTRIGSNAMLYFMPDASLFVGDIQDWSAFGAGFTAGVTANLSFGTRFHSKARLSWYPYGEFRTMRQVESSLSLPLSRNNALEFRHSYIAADRHDKHETLLLWNHFF